MKKRIRKLLHSPSLFFRDYLNKRYPVVRNELLCPECEEQILIKNDLMLESMLNSEFPIDIVFTWVNNKDPAWIEKYNNAAGIITPSEGNYAKDMSRFSNHNELYYAIGSVIKNLPWVNQIYIVTDDQRPDWINEFPTVKVVDHKDIIPQKYLPTFNSHVIEAHLYNIKNLSENFIYFNDDVIVARPLPRGHFFKSNGIASLFVSMKNINAMALKGINTPTLSASLRSATLLKKDFHYLVTIPLVHTYVPLKKSMFTFSWELYRNEIEAFLPNKFRSNNDLNLATFLVPWITYLKGQAVQSRDICYYFNVRSNAARGVYSTLAHMKEHNLYPHSICANDFNTNSMALKNYDLLLKKNLDALFD